MTPEEIEELRALVVRLNGDNMAAILGAALEHIHKQEEQLDNTRAVLSQVAALQEIAIDQLAENNYNFEYNMDNIGKYFWQRDEKIQKKFLDDARRQLAEEHPEAFR